MSIILVCDIGTLVFPSMWKDVEAQHLVAFTSEGDLVSADTSSYRVQQWSRVSNAGDSPECAVHAGWGITVQGEQSNCITRSASFYTLGNAI